MSETPNEQELDYLLEHFRTSGVFKCFECIHCKREETPLGAQFKCVHDGVAVHCAMKDEADIMRGCACFWFEPRGTAGAGVARRQDEIMEGIRELYAFAERLTPETVAGQSADERRLREIAGRLQGLGVHL